MLYLRSKAIRENLAENKYIDSYNELIRSFEEIRKASPAIPNKARKILAQKRKQDLKNQEKEKKIREKIEKGYDGDTERNEITEERKTEIKNKMKLVGKVASLSLKPTDK